MTVVEEADRRSIYIPGSSDEFAAVTMRARPTNGRRVNSGRAGAASLADAHGS